MSLRSSGCHVAISAGWQTYHPRRRLTLSTAATAAAVVARNGFVAIETLDYCQSEFNQSLAPMSMYRILNFLEEQHLIHKLHSSKKYVACSHIACSHSHGTPQFLICQHCQKVEEISIKQDVIESLHKSATKVGFELTTSQLELNCVCESCAQPH